eukprot:Tamp_30089.p1 GENE.Tamp_30089~~Tamp_30089.p1  ORF type:complete len:145 (+),score=31.47 Tamp_30089:25-435(+)
MDGESSERAASKDARKPARQLARNDAAHAPVPGPQHAAQHGARRSVDVGRLVSTLAKEVQLDTSAIMAFRQQLVGAQHSSIKGAREKRSDQTSGNGRATMGISSKALAKLRPEEAALERANSALAQKVGTASQSWS